MSRAERFALIAERAEVAFGSQNPSLMDAATFEIAKWAREGIAEEGMSARLYTARDEND